MAKDKKLVIDASAAIKAIRDLKEEVNKYNQRIIAVRESSVKLSRSMGQTRRVMSNMREKTSEANSALGRFRATIDSVAERHRELRTEVNYARDSFASLDSMIRQLDINSWKAARGLKTFEEHIVKANTTLAREKQIVHESIGIMGLFNAHLAKVTRSMVMKNEAAEVQAQRMNADAAATKKSAAAAGAASKAYMSAVRVFQGMLLYRAFTQIQMAIQQSFDRARRFSIAISEIKTIEGQAGLATAEWARQLRTLNDEFGVPELEAAEGVYQALSDQVVEATRAITFMREEIKLSAAAVSSLSAAVNATDSILNAFGLSAEHASRVNAVLFKTVDLGRARLEDIGDEIGAVAILSDQLNLSLLEQQAALTLLNRKGITFAESVTLLRNLLRALLKPSEAMNDIFVRWGVTSGQGALDTFGLVEVLNRLANEAFNAGDEAAEMAQIFGRMRAIVAAAGLTQKEFNAEIEAFGDATEVADKAFRTRTESMGQRATKHMENIRKFFTETFGDRMVEVFVNFMDAVGGATNFLSTLFDVVAQGVRMLLIYKSTTILVTTAIRAWTTAVELLTFRMKIMSKAEFTNFLSKYRNALTLAGLAVTALVEGIYYLATAHDRLLQSIKEAGVALQQEFTEKGRKAFDRFQKVVDISFDAFERAIRKASQGYNAFVTNLRAWNTQIADSISASLEQSFTNLDKVIRKTTDLLKDELNKVFAEIEGRQKQIDNLIKRADAREKEEQFARGLAAAEEKGILAVQQFQATVFQQALQAMDRGELEMAQTLFDHAKRALERAKALAEQIRDDRDGKDGVAQEQAIQKLIELEKQRRAQVDARIAAERQFAKEEQERIDAEKAAAEERKNTFNQLADILAQVDAFDKGGDPQQFQDLIRQAEELAIAAGLDPEKRLDLLRAAHAQEVELLRKHEQEKMRVELDAIQKRIQTVQEALEDANKKRVESQKRFDEAITEGGKGALANTLGEMKRMLESGELERFTSIRGDALISQAPKRIEAIISAFDQMLAADPSQRVKRAQALVEQIQEFYVFWNKALAERKDIMTGMGVKVLPVQDILKQKQLPDFTKELRDLLEAFKAPLKDHQAIIAQQGDLNAKLALMQDMLRQIPKEFREVEVVQRETVVNQIQTYEGLRKVLQGIINDLKEIKRRQDEMGVPRGAGAGAGNGGAGFAFGTGPRGVDRIPAFLAHGEGVVTAQANRMFAPIIHAMNKANPGLQGQGTTMNFGDIVINQASGSVPLTVDRLLNEINRLKRRGLV